MRLCASSASGGCSSFTPWVCAPKVHSGGVRARVCIRSESRGFTLESGSGSPAGWRTARSSKRGPRAGQCSFKQAKPVDSVAPSVRPAVCRSFARVRTPSGGGRARDGVVCVGHSHLYLHLGKKASSLAQAVPHGGPKTRTKLKRELILGPVSFSECRQHEKQGSFSCLTALRNRKRKLSPWY